MPTLNFTHFSGAVPRYTGYFLDTMNEVLCVVPKSLTVRRYDPFQDVDGLLLDVAQAGAMVANCEPFLNYCLSRHILPLQDVDFWRHGDFFTARPDAARPVLDALLAFAGEYGLPMWEPVTTTYPARYAQRCMALRQNVDDDISHRMVYEAARRAGQSTGAVPVCTLALTLLDFYLRFIEGVDQKQFPVRNADWMMGYGQQKTPALYAQVYDLTTCINLAYVQFSAGEGKTIRPCKNCGKFFLSTDWRSEYCSPNCRGAYNSKMTRKRVKEREERKEAKI